MILTALIVLLALIFAGCEDKPFDPGIQANLDEVYSAYFRIGAALPLGEYGLNALSLYEDEVLDVFNSYTAENCMKPEVIEPTKGAFNWSYADSLISFAAEESATVRGHVLVWHSQTPAWMASGTKEDARANMLDHINAVVGRYADSIYAWDVVNEAVSDSGGYRTSSLWYQAYGDATFIQDAFDFAYAADNDAQLFYNDYSVVSSSKRQDIVDMINDLDLIDSHHMTGIGMQAHWSLTWPSAADIATTIQTFGAMGLDVHITELDINTYGTADSPELRNSLAARYDELFGVFRDNADIVTNVTLWGVADDHTWLDDRGYGKTYPLLFNEDHEAKQAYNAILEF